MTKIYLKDFSPHKTSGLHFITIPKHVRTGWKLRKGEKLSIYHDTDQDIVVVLPKRRANEMIA